MQDAIITLSANESLCRLFVIASNEEASQFCSNAAKLAQAAGEQEGFQQLPWHTDTHGTPPAPMGGIKVGLLGGPPRAAPSQRDPKAKAQLELFLLGMTKDGIVP